MTSWPRRWRAWSGGQSKNCRWQSNSMVGQGFPYFPRVGLPLREGAYAVGLEPSTHDVGGDAVARADGSMIWLGAGESRAYHPRFRLSPAAWTLARLSVRSRHSSGQPTSDVPA